MEKGSTGWQDCWAVVGGCTPSRGTAVKAERGLQRECISQHFQMGNSRVMLFLVWCGLVRACVHVCMRGCARGGGGGDPQTVGNGVKLQERPGGLRVESRESGVWSLESGALLWRSLGWVVEARGDENVTFLQSPSNPPNDPASLPACQPQQHRSYQSCIAAHATVSGTWPIYANSEERETWPGWIWS